MNKRKKIVISLLFILFSFLACGPEPQTISSFMMTTVSNMTILELFIMMVLINLAT